MAVNKSLIREENNETPSEISEKEKLNKKRLARFNEIVKEFRKKGIKLEDLKK